MADFAPPVAFHFSVVIGLASPTGEAAAFQEVSGLEAEMETEMVTEGGENTFVHQLPKQVKHPNLKLKRAVLGLTNPLVTWCKEVLEEGLSRKISPLPLTVSLLNENGNPTALWTLSNAYPIKWAVGDFDSMKNEIAIESIEMSYNSLTRTL